ncbi:MAG: hypothetical protein DHS20C02_13420 [Micavibrio sp.]|nr:MAG: hypothetical protein DHS20C02_13420 [Micavibrio sp.]
MHGVQAKKVVSYMVMPGILPRAKGLFASGFGYLAFLMANIYFMVRLLPYNHPYLLPTNIGKFGIRHVIAEAANNLVVKKENVDQLIIFAALLISTVLLLLQLVLLVWTLVVAPAMAVTIPAGISIFEINTPFSDTAYILLDSVFGIPDLFQSCVSFAAICPGAQAASPAFPTPFHIALHSLFQYYSIGILLIGVLIFLYFLVVVVVETAVTGTPFGQRFASVWTPVRLVVAIGLLIPLNFGMNSGQYIALYSAKFGSNLATNGWLLFNSAIEKRSGEVGANSGFSGVDNPTGESLSLVALPKQQDASVMVQFMSIVHTCAYIERLKQGNNGAIDPPIDYVDDFEAPIQAYFVKHEVDWLPNKETSRPAFEIVDTYVEALEFYGDSDIIIRFGEQDAIKYPKEKGNVFPTCGEIRIKVSDLSDKGQGDAVGGPDYMLMSYYNMVKQMWNQDRRMRDFAVRMVELNTNLDADWACFVGCGAGSMLPSCPDDCLTEIPSALWKQDVTNEYQTLHNFHVSEAWIKYAQGGADFGIGSPIMERGWAGAGMWYNRIAQLNGAFITSVLDFPNVESYPRVMEEVRAVNRKENAKITAIDQFKPNLGGKKSTKIESGGEGGENAKALNAVFEYWNKEGANMADPEKAISNNIFIDTMNILFGTGGLFAMRNENLHTHPLAQLVGVGKGLVEASIRNLGTSAVTAFLGGMGGALNAHGAGALEGAAGFFSSIAFVGLTAGVVLYYVLPFLPFVYFYFAVGSWIKSIFEAMVGVPLWALAHLRIDGEGLPGDSAMNGYFLIFEIFIRPILTIFGLIAAITIFTAQVRILNIIWDSVTENLAGYNDNPNFYTIVGSIEFKRSTIDQFFFTIIYTMVVYMLATASFKLIDKLPDNILRWMGTGVSSFSDINQDPAESLTKYAALGGVSISNQFSGAIQRASQGTGKAVGNIIGGGKESSAIKAAEARGAARERARDAAAGREAFADRARTVRDRNLSDET